METARTKEEPKVLLVCTVGGAPEPVVAGILSARPARVIFVCSPETRNLVEQGDAKGNPSILERLAQNGFPVSPGQYDIEQVENSQDLEGFVARMRRAVEPRVREWIGRADGYEVVVDFTGGTKCMSAGMVLASLDWRCRWQYVGGTERTKEGVGIVVDGKEQAVHPKNPWDTLAWRHVLRAAALFDEGDTGGAVAVLKAALREGREGAVKRALAALQHFCSIYWHWDAFRHEQALKSQREFMDNPYSLCCLLSGEAIENLCQKAREDAPLLEELTACQGPERILIADLYRNGDRRMQEERWDDAVARFYRCTEALAQHALREHGIESTSRVPLEKIPESLRQDWNLSPERTQVELPLRKGYELLAALGDPLGQRFLSSRLGNERVSPLMARNVSILAHGFRPVSENDAKALQKALCELFGGDPGHPIPAFPKLGEVIELR
ncbi:MAG: TIGR02710 family CRISPR-associated CARF protein [Bryobacteraceae bacterium]